MPENTLPENLDSVLRKYGKIWIWSILSAAVAALSVRTLNNTSILAFQSMAGAIGGPRNNLWTPLVMFWAFVPSIGTLAAVCFLLKFLRHHILPILFPPSPAAAPAHTEAFTLAGASAEAVSAPTEAAQDVPNGANLLYGAFASIVVALALEAVGVLGSIVYRAVAT
jgi:hypothetical protein